MTKDMILDLITSENVSYIKLQFSDIDGMMKVVEVPVSQINDVLSNNVMFDGSSIQGLVRITESDMFLAPDLESFRVVPWESSFDNSKVAMFMCDILNVNKQFFSGDPRSILKKQIMKMQEMGFDKFNIGLEPEFFLFENIDPNNKTVKLTDNTGYFDYSANDKGARCRRDIVLNLEKLGFEIEASHHEVSSSQHEINFKYDGAVECCDRVQIFKSAVKTIASQHNMSATFMPKPIFGINGSGMHANLSLFDIEGNNIFYDPNNKSELSQTAYYFIGGLLKYAKEYTAITNPIVNSYKRLVPGYEAPNYIAYSDSNRSAMIRIPATRKSATRVEVRNVDATANPYLAMSVLLASGLKGIEEKIDPGCTVDENLFTMSEERRIELGIEYLPKSLTTALKEMKNSELVKDVLGEHTFMNFLESKHLEYSEYRREVHTWEIDKYITKF